MNNNNEINNNENNNNSSNHTINIYNEIFGISNEPSNINNNNINIMENVLNITDDENSENSESHLVDEDDEDSIPELVSDSDNSRNEENQNANSPQNIENTIIYRFMNSLLEANNNNYSIIVGDETINVELTEEDILRIKEKSNKRAIEIFDGALVSFEKNIDLEMYEKINGAYLNYVYNVWNSNNLADIVDYIYSQLNNQFYNVSEITEQLFGYSNFYDNYAFRDFENIKTIVFKQLKKIFDSEERNNFLRDIVEERYERNKVRLILTQEEIEKLPSCVYENYALTIQENNKQCSICFDDFEKTSECKSLKCNHIFHSNCVTEWLSNYSHKCPVCRIESDNYKADI
jgi:hypothetical protein